MIRLGLAIFAAFVVVVSSQRPYQETGRPYSCTGSLERCVVPVRTIGTPGMHNITHERQCVILKRAANCMKAEREKCLILPANEPIVRALDAYNDLINYMCVEKYDDFRRASMCAKSDAVQTDVVKCLKTVMNVTRIHPGIVDRSQFPDKESFCKSQASKLRALETCELASEDNVCGKRVVSLYTKVFDKVKKIQTVECETVTASSRPTSLPSVSSPPQRPFLEKGRPYSCTDSLERCVVPVRTIGTHNMHKMDHERQCVILKRSANCIKAELEKCFIPPANATIVRVVPAYTDLINYICEEKYYDFLRASKCANSEAVQRDVAKCLKTVTGSPPAEADQSQFANRGAFCKSQAKQLKAIEVCELASEDNVCGKRVVSLYTKVFEKVKKIQALECAAESGTHEPDDEIKTGDDKCVRAINNCLVFLEPHRQGLTRFRLETIPQLCSDVRKANMCMDKTAKTCEVTDEWRLLQEAFTQICDHDEIGVPSCAVRREVVTKLRSCESEKLTTTEYGLNDDQLCREIDNYVNCYTVTVDKKCEPSGREFVRQVMSGVSQVIRLDKEVVCEQPEPTERPESDADSIVESWGPLGKCMEHVAEFQMSAIPVHKYHSLDDFCSDALAAETCGNGVNVKQPKMLKMRWDEFRTVVDYMCKDKRSEFQEVFSCLSNNLDDQIISKCYSTVEDEVSEMSSEEDSSEESSAESSERMGYKMKGRVCKMMHDFDGCLEKTVSKYCGHESGKLVRGLTRKMENLLARDHIISCPHWAARHALVIGLATGGAVLLLVIVAGICACYRKRRSASFKLDKKQLVKNEVLQANLQLSFKSDNEKGVKA